MRVLPYVVFETTEKCNLRCGHCYNHYKAPGAASPLKSSYRGSMKTLRKLYSLADIRTLVMSGGEPFLAERFEELVLFARMKGSAVKILSNGCAGTLERYRKLIDMGSVAFQFPLHSAEARVHDAVTGVAGSWERSLRSIAEVRSLGGEPFAVNVISRRNQDGIGALLNLVIETGVKRVLFLRYNVGGPGAGNPEDLIVKKSALKEVFSVAEQYASGGKLAITSNVCTPICVIDPDDYPHVGFTHCSPDPAKLPVTVDYTGDFRRCNHSPVVLGNIFTGGLEPLFSLGDARWESVPERCAGCAKFEKCRGGCRAAAEQYYRDAALPDPYIELSGE
ncbi:MAG: radical SAM protein [Spirochaetes bacterium]|nr:radical SAM protein [Spirochaetota bacterium]